MSTHAPSSRCLIVSDFNPGNFAGYLENDEASPAVEVLTGDFGQVIPILANPEADVWSAPPEYVVVWTQPERVIPAFQKLLDSHAVALADLLAEVDEFTAAIIQAAGRVKAIFVASWVVDPDRRGLGMADLRPGGVGHALQQLNARLTANLGQTINVFLLDAQRWISRAGKEAFAPKLWYQAKVPFGNLVFQDAVADLKAAILGLTGQAKKLIIVDLDDTLWGGVVGDVGWENLRVGGHDPVGEAFADLQRTLKALTRRGILLGIVSKNEESTALAALQQHPEMLLRPSDFAGWRINWEDKAANVAALANDLKLGLHSVVFLDDNRVERARVRESLPEVLVPEWPENPQLAPGFLLALRCFDTPRLSAEDAARNAAYAAERTRTEQKQSAGSLSEWLQGLGTVVEIAPLTPANLGRATQLLNKTNQMNLRTRRLSEAELKRWADGPQHRFWVFRVSDKYGDSGLTGLASLELDNGTAKVADFVLSCRVMGRKLEETMLHWLILQARDLGASELTAEYLPTDKNKPCLDFWRHSGFVSNGNALFAWLTGIEFAAPAGIQLKVSVQ